MSSKILLRIASVIMFLRLIGQAIVPYTFSAELTKIQDYLWQHSDTTSNHQFLYWGYCIVFGIVSRLLMLISEATDKTRSFGAALIEPAFFFLLAFGVEELVFQYYFSGSITILTAILVALAYFKMRGMSIKVTYDQSVD